MLIKEIEDAVLKIVKNILSGEWYYLDHERTERIVMTVM